jgi:heavy metal translocating P-type ATPase
LAKDLFNLTGLSCAACVARVEKAVKALPGVTRADVSLLKSELTLERDDSLAPPTVIEAIARAGYGARLASAGAEASRETPGERFRAEARAILSRLKISVAFAVPLFYLAMGHMLAWPLPAFFADAAGALPLAFTQFLLLIPVAVANRDYFAKGFRNLALRSPNMDSLIAVGSGAAILYGLIGLYLMMARLGSGDLHGVHLAMNFLYFESAATILTLVTVGKFLETRAKARTGDAVAGLLALAPKTARILRDGRETVVEAKELAVGDLLLLKSGETAAADGEVASGNGAMDESALTGESLPVEKEPGQKVTGGTTLLSGYLEIALKRVGDDATLAQIIRLVDEATSAKAPIARLADRISAVFAPAVIFVALSAGILWFAQGQPISFALSVMISVLVISCPCALGLATPTAIMVGTGRGANLGVLFKSPAALERTRSVDAVVLDKTGTLTQGKPLLKKIRPAPGIAADKLLETFYALEAKSEHPLAKAVAEAAQAQNIPLRDAASFRQLPGVGLAGTVDGAEIFAGNRKILERLGLQDEGLFSMAEKLSQEGLTTLFAATKERALGLVALGDSLKPTSARAVRELERLGIATVMLTGDNRLTAEAVARECGIKTVIAEVYPADKEKEIRALQDSGRVAAMVGDGVNDAPALARADVGVALGAGTDIAMEAADVVLMRDDLLSVPAAIQLSRAVYGNIRQNLFWAFGYNIVGIPIACGLFYPAFGWTLNPTLAAAMMSLSSVCVVSNALRLRAFKPKLGSAPEADSPPTALAGTETDPAVPSAPSATAAAVSTVPTISTVSTIPTIEESARVNIKLKVDGMTCGHCSARVQKVLSEAPGVTQATVSLEAGVAEVAAAEGTSPEGLAAIVADAGYSAKVL